MTREGLKTTLTFLQCRVLCVSGRAGYEGTCHRQTEAACCILESAKCGSVDFLMRLLLCDYYITD